MMSMSLACFCFSICTTERGVSFSVKAFFLPKSSRSSIVASLPCRTYSWADFGRYSIMLLQGVDSRVGGDYFPPLACSKKTCSRSTVPLRGIELATMKELLSLVMLSGRALPFLSTRWFGSFKTLCWLTMGPSCPSRATWASSSNVTKRVLT